RGGTPVDLTPVHAGLQGEGVVDVCLEVGGDLLVLLQGEGLQAVAGVHAVAHQFAHDAVGLPEGHALLGQVVGAVGGGDEAAVGRRPHVGPVDGEGVNHGGEQDRKSTRLNSSHVSISYAVFCLKKKKKTSTQQACLH